MKRLTKKHSKRTIIATIFSTVFFVALFVGTGAYAFAAEIGNKDVYLWFNSSTYQHTLSKNSQNYNDEYRFVIAPSGKMFNFTAERSGKRTGKTQINSNMPYDGKVWLEFYNDNQSIHFHNHTDCTGDDVTYISATNYNILGTATHFRHYTEDVTVTLSENPVDQEEVYIRAEYDK